MSAHELDTTAWMESLGVHLDAWQRRVVEQVAPAVDHLGERMAQFATGTLTLSGTFDVVTEPTRTYTRRTPVVLRLRPGKAFRAVATVTTEIAGAEATYSITYSPADRRRLNQYLHPEVYARRSAMHSAYRRRHR